VAGIKYTGDLLVNKNNNQYYVQPSGQGPIHIPGFQPGAEIPSIPPTVIPDINGYNNTGGQHQQPQQPYHTGQGTQPAPNLPHSTSRPIEKHQVSIYLKDIENQLDWNHLSPEECTENCENINHRVIQDIQKLGYSASIRDNGRHVFIEVHTNNETVIVDASFPQFSGRYGAFIGTEAQLHNTLDNIFTNTGNDFFDYFN